MNKWTHIILDLHNVNLNNLTKLSRKEIISFFVNIIKKNWLLVLWEKFHFFWKKSSFTWIVLLWESHFSIHTWPEFNYVSIDLFCCNLKSNNEKKLENIINEVLDIFNKDIKITKQIINR